MKNETFETRIYTGTKCILQGETKSLEEAAKLMHPEHTMQCTFEDIENGLHKGSFSHIMHFRDDEHYNDLYYIHQTK